MRYTNNKFLLAVLSLLVLSTVSIAQEDIEVGETTRKMLAYAPSGIKDNSPLLISMHGMNQDIAYQQNQSKWEDVADENGFVVVYPAGINNSWDIGGTSDTDFILAIIDEMAKRYSIDRNRVYLSGFSMGGMMTYHAATLIADKIAAFAPVSGYLMGGPNTNSSRPIPIIHTHGTTDDVVAFSGVQTCLDAWIERNGCPTTAVVTKPYPADKPSSNGTKYYWGKGKDNVEIVLISLTGNGHWHSNNVNGVHTSKEIWNFCKNYSLAWGIPKLLKASVTDENPKQINAVFSESIKDTNSFEGFSVKIDDLNATIDSIVLLDSNKLVIALTDTIKNTNNILLTYNNGNVISVYEKALEAFSDNIVENILNGSSPRIVDLATNFGGDSIFIEFNKKMFLPSQISGTTLNADFIENFDIPIEEYAFLDSDSTTLVFKLSEKVYADYNLTLSYTGNNIVSADSGMLKTFTAVQVTNNSKGLPVHIENVTMEADGSTLAMQFSKDMVMTKNQLDQLVLNVNGEHVAFLKLSVSNATIKLTLDGNMHYGDVATISYTPDNITAYDLGALDAFTDFTVDNTIVEPTWHEIPGKVEAEDYALQMGTDTETTSDDGGGLNIGWIDTGDWVDYAIQNTTTETKYEVTFRIAAASSGGKFNYYIDNNKVGQIAVPSTGDWQTWKSVSDTITVSPGKHYLKLYATSGGFNINYFIIDEPKPVGVKNNNLADAINVYPNPATNSLTIQSVDFKFNKIEIFDMIGNQVMIKDASEVLELNLHLHLSDGIYFLKVSNENEYQLKKFIVRNR
ncbi:MAG: carbohydrate-binding protein [Prolixibacteraceae bacterium]|nr:carbohydrate-binding protein [Prolixibacteraceae bacterium]